MRLSPGPSLNPPMSVAYTATSASCLNSFTTHSTLSTTPVCQSRVVNSSKSTTHTSPGTIASQQLYGSVKTLLLLFYSHSMFPNLFPPLAQSPERLQSMHYHFAILLLFRPFIKFNLSHSLVSPHDVCLQASDAISVLVRSYSDLYSLRRTPSLAPYIVMTSSIMHIYYWGNETEIAAKEERTAKILQGWRDLGEMSSSHGFAGRGRKILSFLVKRWNLDLSLDDDDIEASMEVNEDGRPRSISLNLFCVGLESGWLMKGIGKTSQGLDATQEMEIDSAVGSLMEEENSLFGPFLLQGLPLMATGRKDLQEAGFGIRA